MSVIGGADGPTSVFIAGNFSWLNLWGLILVVLLLIPNILYAIKVKNHENKCANPWMNAMEQIGRYGCLFLMVFNIGIAEFGFPSVGMFLVYLFGNPLLLISYWIIWILYFNKQSDWKALSLAVLPACLFLLNGITMRHFLLIGFALLFAIGHIYVTIQNRSA